MKENNFDTVKNAGNKNSIEEAIERLEKGINDIWFSTTYSQEQEEKDLKILLSDYKRVLKENEKLKNIRYDTPYGTETIHLIPESNLIEINTQKYMIEVDSGKFVDLKQLYLENKKLNEYKENYIPIQKVKDKIEEIKQEKKKYGNCLIEMYEDELVNRDIKILQELLESEE